MKRLALFLIAVLVACSGSQLDREMVAANALGISANHVEPVWIDAYHREGSAAIEAACPRTRIAEPGCIARRVAASDAVTARWRPVRLQWDIAVRDHDALASCLEASLDGGLCPNGDARRAALAASVLTFRCEVRAMGHPELDIVPGVAPDCSFQDGGQ